MSTDPPPQLIPTENEADLFARVQAAFEGRYDLEQLIASSPIRALFLVRDVVLKRQEALRINFESGRHRRWFERETELLASLDHPSIRAVFSAGYVGDWMYRATKFIEGESLADAVARGPRSIPVCIQLFRDLMSVLEYAHSRQVVLRRIVPANVMLDLDGRTIITDLRYANRCLAYADADPEGEAFLAPETWHGHAGEPASDIYAAGAILYFALTGRPPAADPRDIAPPTRFRPTCPQAVQRVILRALKADPLDRYLSAEEMAEDLFSELGEFEGPRAGPIARESDDPVAWEKRLRRALGDEYELLDELGAGGFGTVYRVRDLRLEREVALKVLHPHLSADPVVVERFHREAQLAARLNHPNIVNILDTGGRAGLLWYTMEYVPGLHLGRVVQQNGALGVQQLVDLLDEALSALDHAHARGIVHRDLKPENLLLDATTGDLRITDFGLAIAVYGERFGGASSHSGTPEFASPEQLLGEPVDRRADLYSLSVVAFFTLTGTSPFAAPTVEAVVARQAAGQLPDLKHLRPDVPAGLAQILARGAARHPGERFDSAQAYRKALGNAVRISGSRTRSPWFRRLFTP